MLDQAELEQCLDDPAWLLRRAADLLDGTADQAHVLLAGGAEDDEEG